MVVGLGYQFVLSSRWTLHFSTVLCSSRSLTYVGHIHVCLAMLNLCWVQYWVTLLGCGRKRKWGLRVLIFLPSCEPQCSLTLSNKYQVAKILSESIFWILPLLPMVLFQNYGYKYFDVAHWLHNSDFTSWMPLYLPIYFISIYFTWFLSPTTYHVLSLL